eukprot:224111_1
MATPALSHSFQLILMCIHLGVATILWFSMIYIIHHFCLNISREKISITGKILAITFILLSLLALGFHTTDVFFVYQPASIASNQTFFFIVTLGRVLFFALQIYLSLIIFFERLLAVFCHTKFRISVYITRSYQCFWIFFPASGLFVFALSLITGSTDSRTWKLICSITGFILLTLVMISLLILYIVKLISVYKSIEFANDKFLVNAITKTTILASFSILITIFNIIIIASSGGNPSSDAVQWLQFFMTLCNIYINFLCVVLFYHHFKPLYTKCCSCFDTKCNKCWEVLVVDTLMLAHMIQTNSASTHTSKSNQEHRSKKEETDEVTPVETVTVAI